MFFDKCITGALEENDFEIVCSFATSDGTCTLGFILNKNSKPLTLLKGNVLRKPSPVELIIQKDFNEGCISKIVFNKNNLSLSEIVQLLPLEMGV